MPCRAAIGKTQTKLDRKTFTRLLDRYLKGQAGARERNTIDQWYDGFSELADEEAFTHPDRERQVRESLYTRIHQQIQPVPAYRRLARILRAAAAVLLVAAAALWLYRAGDARQPESERYQTFVTGVRQVKKIVLPDSSLVWMNANTTIRIPERFGQDGIRPVFLDEGEASFEVQHDTERPFLVHSGALQTTVLGTVFNVRNYSLLQTVTVGVTNGSVRVTDTANRILADALHGGERLSMDRSTRQFVVDAATESQGAGWQEGIVRLRNATITDLQVVLRNSFGVTLRVANPAIHEHRYNLTLPSTYTLDQALKVICSIHANQYRRDADDVISIY